MINNPNEKPDGFQGILNGVDSGRSPALLDRGQLSWLINGTTRGGFVTCRPGIFKHDLRFLNESGQTDSTIQANFEEGGRFQGASGYISDTGKGYLVASIGGMIFRIDTDSLVVHDLSTPAGYTNSPEAPQAWFCQAENILVIQNGEEVANIFNGSTLRKSTSLQGGKEVPNGTAMAYNNGRLWVALPDGYSFVAGDLAYVGGNRQNFLNFTENEYLTGGGKFVVPANAGPIRAMQSIAVQDSTTGQGPLQVFTTRGVFSINAPFDRTLWQTTQSPIQTISSLASGSESQNATVAVNGDLWFRASDGVRSFVIARRDHGTWVNTPLSREVERALKFDSLELLRYSSAVLFDNRLLLTTQPERVLGGADIRGVVHNGLVVLDFAPTSQMFNRTNPTWDGVWTGLRILQAVTVPTDPARCFLFVLDEDDKVALWELSRDARFDNGSTQIQWAIETPDYAFEDGGWGLKKLQSGDVWRDRIAGEITTTIKYRSDSYPFWNSWHTWTDCAGYRDCDISDCTLPTRKYEQYRVREKLPKPSDACDTVTDKPHRIGYRFGARIEVTGFCRIRQFRMWAEPLPEHAGGCVASVECDGEYSGCPATDDYSYQIES